MKILQQDREQQFLALRVRDTLRSGFENVSRGMNAYIALGATVMALAASAELAAPEPVAATTPPRPTASFKLGQYVGTTSQTCPAPAADVGLCVEGEKIPVSFTATKTKIIDFHTAVTTTCRAGTDKIGNGTFSLDFKQVKLDKRYQFSAAILKTPGNAQSAAEGNLHGAKAEGGVGFAVELNKVGERDSDGGTYCQSDFISFEAERVG